MSTRSIVSTVLAALCLWRAWYNYPGARFLVVGWTLLAGLWLWSAWQSRVAS